MADRHTMEILEVGLAHWKLYLLDLIKDRLSACLVREVQNDRMGIDGQQDCIHASVESFRRVGELRDNERSAMARWLLSSWFQSSRRTGPVQGSLFQMSPYFSSHLIR
ncbi:hypothetical protein X801_09867 [Opisthorchis viverrini]|uniref:Cullin N-terminal domain-containing protein n=1 Tax=Opisthorchis viverrini TaxID=6198 RepID=A0A1S8WIT6_OPIVI|nr:hypothetical protein X801_09867 [Opisthorchis viverrini]